MEGQRNIIEIFLGYLKDELAYSPQTLRLYRTGLEMWLKFENKDAGNFDPKDVTTNDIRAWVATMSSHGISAGTIKHRLSTVRSFYRFLIKRHGYSFNPAASVQIKRREKTLPKFVNTEEMGRLLDDMDTEAQNSNDFEEIRNDLILNLLYQTGMRASELVGLTDSRIDTSRGELKVLGKRNKERIIPIGESLCQLLTRYMAVRTDLFGHCDSLLVDKKGDPIKYRKVYDIVTKALQGNVSSVRKSPHVLRHSFATDMLSGGADLSSVRKLLGHESLATTQIYTHVSINELYENYNMAHPRARKNTK